MGKERSRAYYGSCPCGSGTIEVDFCTPDHPWPTKSHSFESSIGCEKCAAKYTFQQQGHQYGLVDKREIKDKEIRYENYKTAQTDLLNSAQAKEVISPVISLLDSQPSVAATYRLLKLHKLVYESYGAFVKKWKGAEAWVKSHVGMHADVLSQFSKITGLEDEYLSEAVSNLKTLWAAYQRRLTFQGGAMFDASHYR